MSRDLVDEGIAAGCMEWVPDDIWVRAIASKTLDALFDLLVALGQANLTAEQTASIAKARDRATAALIESGRVPA